MKNESDGLTGQGKALERNWRCGKSGPFISYLQSPGRRILPRPPFREAPAFLFWPWFSGILSAQAAAGGRNHNACVECPTQGRVRFKFSQTVLGRRKEGRVAAEKKLWL